MKRFIILPIILLATAGMLSAQERFDLSARNVEPARCRLTPYHNTAEAVKGGAVSRFVATVEQPTAKVEGNKTTFSTFYILPINWLNRQVILRVGHATTAYTVYINGREVGFAPTGAIAAEFNITKASVEGRNEIAIVLDRSLLANKLYEPKGVELGGVEVFSQPTIRIRDVVSKVTLNDRGEGVAEFAIPVKCDALNPKSMRMRYTLRLNDTVVMADGYRELTLDMRREDTLRFVCVVPRQALWSVERPTMVRLDLESRIENRIVEAYSRRIGLRQLLLQEGTPFLNNKRVDLKLVDATAIKSLDKARKAGYNAILITLDKGAEALIEECARKGFYVVVRTPINTLSLGDHIRRGGNPSNDPLWNESYLWRNAQTLHATKGCCAVVGYEIAEGHTSGINIYDSYVMLKSLVPNHLVIYGGAKGEWATDK